MSGLNEGLEIDDDLGHAEGDALHRIFDNPEPGEIPDLNPETKVITAVANNVNDLNLLRADIQDKGGMDRNFALECENLIQNFLTPSQPLTMFTSFPTKTNYVAALEAIEEKKHSLVQAIIDAMKRMLDKLIAWLKSVGEKLMSDRVAERAARAKEYFSGNAANTQADLNSLQTAYNDPKAAVSRVKSLSKDAASPEVKNYVDSLQNRLDDGAVRLENLYTQINGSDMLYHLVTESDIYDHVMKVTTRVEPILASLRQLDEQSMKDFMDLSEDPASLESKAKGLTQSLKRLANQYGVRSFQEHDDALRVKLRHRGSAVTSSTHPLSKIFAKVARTFSDFSSEEFAKSVSLATTQLQAIRDRIDTVSQKTRLDATERSRQNYTFVTDLYRAIYNEIRGVAQVLGAANQLHSDWTLIATMLASYTKDFHNRVQVHLSTLDEGSAKLIKQYFRISDKSE